MEKPYQKKKVSILSKPSSLRRLANMPPLPAISGKVLMNTLQKAGFNITRQRGSHVQMRHPDGRTCTIPLHGNTDLPRGTLRGILRDIDISVEKLIALL